MRLNILLPLTLLILLTGCGAKIVRWLDCLN